MKQESIQDSQCKPCSLADHVRERDRGWEGGGEGYWRKVSLEEQDFFLPSHPLTLPCDKLSQQVLYSALQPGEMTARLSAA